MRNIGALFRTLIFVKCFLYGFRREPNSRVPQRRASLEARVGRGRVEGFGRPRPANPTTLPPSHPGLTFFSRLVCVTQLRFVVVLEAP